MVQIKSNVARPLQLVLDMKVRWSSTYVMLDRAERHKEVSSAGKVKLITDQMLDSALTISSMNCVGKKKTL